MKKIIITIIALVIIFTVWYKFFRMTKAKAIKLIVQSGMHKNTSSFLDGAGESYVINWAKAIKVGDTTFEDNGKIHTVFGGKIV